MAPLALVQTLALSSLSQPALSRRPCRVVQIKPQDVRVDNGRSDFKYFRHLMSFVFDCDINTCAPGTCLRSPDGEMCSSLSGDCFYVRRLVL